MLHHVFETFICHIAKARVLLITGIILGEKVAGFF